MSSLEKFSSEEAETYNSSEEEADENDDGTSDLVITYFLYSIQVFIIL